MAGRRRSILALCLVTSYIAPINSASSSETVAFKYDERGRLTKVSRSGSINNGANACYTYDRADNRTNVTAGTIDCAPPPPPVPPSFSINDVAVTEGGNLVLTVTKTGTTSSSLSVNFASANGTATAGSDYTANSGTLTFLAADTTKTITITTADDAEYESPETVLVTLSSATGGATIGDAQGIGTLNDNEAPPACGGISFTIVSYNAVTEGSPSTFIVTKTGTTPSSCSVNYATANVTATAGSDYTAKSGTLSFTSSQTTQTVDVSTTDDAVMESAEDFSLALSSPTGGATVGTPGSATATINDNDTPPPPSFSINDSGGTEGSNIPFIVTRAGTTSGTYSVNYITSDGTAVAGTDYVAASGTVTFAPNETTKTVWVLAAGDQDVEGDETFSISLYGPTSGATIGDGEGTGTISDYVDPGGGGGICRDERGVIIPCDGLTAAPPAQQSSPSGEVE